MPRILKRPQAETDLIDIWLYIAQFSRLKADAYLRDLERAMKLLAGEPLMGRSRDELAAGIRSFPAQNHIIFYFAVENGIEIVRVLHSRQDYASII